MKEKREKKISNERAERESVGKVERGAQDGADHEPRLDAHGHPRLAGRSDAPLRLELRHNGCGKPQRMARSSATARSVRCRQLLRSRSGSTWDESDSLTTP